MADGAVIAREFVAALNVRDYAAIAALADEDVAISGIGGSSDMGRDALRDRLARHFAALDEAFGDAVVMQATGGSPVAIRVTARGKDASGAARSADRLFVLELDGGRITRLSMFAESGA